MLSQQTVLTEEVDVLVDGIALDSWEAELLNKLALQVLNVASNSSNLQCLGLSSFEVLCPTSVSAGKCFFWISTFLSDICHEAHDLFRVSDSH